MNRKKLSRIHAERQTLDRILFGSDAAPTVELGVERAAMIAEFRAVQADWEEPNAQKLWKYLEEALQSYNAEKDGRSRIMQLAERIHEHMRKEQHASDGRVVAPTGNA